MKVAQHCQICGYTAAERAVHGCSPGGCLVAAGTSQDPARCLINSVTAKPRGRKLRPSRWAVLETIESSRERLER